MHLIWSSEVKCVVTVWFLWSFWYILSNGVGDVTNRWRHFWFTSQHQSDLKYITHNSGSHYCFYYRSHQHTRTRNKNIYIAIKDYPQIRVWSYLPQVVHSFWERPICVLLHVLLLCAFALPYKKAKKSTILGQRLIFLHLKGCSSAEKPQCTDKCEGMRMSVPLRLEQLIPECWCIIQQFTLQILFKRWR